MATASKKKAKKRKPAQKGKPSRWKKGQSGNPKGRKPDAELKKARDHAKQLIGPYSKRIVDALVDVMENDSSGAARVMAANSLADRLWGKPAQRVEHTGDEGGPVRIEAVQDEIISQLDRLFAQERA